jgi:hypothetical protein
MEIIYSPVFGTINQIDLTNKKIEIYLDIKKNPLGIFSPISGILSNISVKNLQKKLRIENRKCISC